MKILLSASISKKFISNIKWQLFANISLSFFAGIYTLLIGRLLGVEGFGVYASVLAFAAVFSAIPDARIQDIVARDFATIHENNFTYLEIQRLSSITILDIVTKLISCILLILFAKTKPFGLMSDYVSNELLIICAIGNVLTKSTNSMSVGLLRVFGRTDLSSFCQNMDWIVKIFITLILAYFKQISINSVIMASITSGLLSNILIFKLAHHELGKRYKVSLVDYLVSFDVFVINIRKIMAISLSNILLSFSDIILRDLDVTIISIHLTSQAVGIYKMSKTAALLLWKVIDPIYFALIPEVQNLWIKNDREEQNNFIIKISVLLFLLSISVVTVGSTLASIILPFFLGRGFEGVPSALKFMLPWIVLCAPLIWTYPVSIAINKSHYAAIGGLLSLIVGCVAFYIGALNYGLAGSIVAWNLTMTISFYSTAYLIILNIKKKLS